ncbi:hypothetical protein [uncultured Tolumonas sp.]|uniref:hypothetical protein n=1 Tax=uncultured Tolumonas sp. TaxID=263765 RepID=UPI002A0A7AD8|nr:hypothetical protein [uncultured Tolumonas sp.]
MQPITTHHDTRGTTKNDQLVIGHDTLCKKIDDFGCHIVELYATLKAFGLNTRTGWRIQHPTAAKTDGKFVPSSQSNRLMRLQRYIWGHGSGAKENAPTVPFRWSALLCGYPIRHWFSTNGTLNMIYTFLIAATRGRIADVQRIRTISAVANTETEARARLTGLPLIFMSRTPAQGGAV